MTTTPAAPAAAAAAAPAASPAAAPAAAPAPAAAAPAAAPAAPAAGTPPAPVPPTATPGAPDYSWAGDDKAQAIAKAKGWASPADALKSYSELEGYLGGDKVPLPKDEGDKAGYDRLWKTLGRPDTPDGYGIKPPEGADPALSTEYATKAHELGLTTKQANELLAWHEAKGGEMGTASQAETDARIDGDVKTVKDDWGPNFNANAEVARRGTDALGWDKAKIEAIEAHPLLGHKWLMDTALKVGQMTGEGRMHNPGGQGSFAPVTKESAQARLQEIKDNPQLRSEALKPGSEINKEVDRLDMIIAGVKPTA